MGYNNNETPVQTEWRTVKKPLFSEMAHNRGFSIEERNSLFCLGLYPNMTEDQFALICDICGKARIMSKSEVNENDFQNIKCESGDKCEPIGFIEDAFCERTVWIPDCKNMFDYISIDSDDEPSASFFASAHDYQREVYFAVDPDRDMKDSTLVFYRLYEDENPKIDKKILFDFKLDNESNKRISVGVPCIHETYINRLYDAITETLSRSTANQEMLQKSVDAYVGFYRTCCIERVSDSRERHKYSKRYNETKALLEAQKCPICRKYTRSTDVVCVNCGFDDLNKIFINKDEYQSWMNNVVLPIRAEYEKVYS